MSVFLRKLVGAFTLIELLVVIGIIALFGIDALTANGIVEAKAKVASCDIDHRVPPVSHRFAGGRDAAIEIAKINARLNQAALEDQG